MLRRCPSYLPDLYLRKWIPGSFTFHGSEVGLNNQLFHRSSFPPFLKTEVIFIFFQCSGISPRIHDLGKTIGNGLTMAQPAPSAPMGGGRAAGGQRAAGGPSVRRCAPTRRGEAERRSPSRPGPARRCPLPAHLQLESRFEALRGGSEGGGGAGRGGAGRPEWGGGRRAALRGDPQHRGG